MSGVRVWNPRDIYKTHYKYVTASPEQFVTLTDYKAEIEARKAAEVRIEELRESRSLAISQVTALRAERDDLQRQLDNLRDLSDLRLRDLTSCQARRDELAAAISWALGEGDSDFRARHHGEGLYYWRTELRHKRDAALSPAPTAPKPEAATDRRKGERRVRIKEFIVGMTCPRASCTGNHHACTRMGDRRKPHVTDPPKPEVWVEEKRVKQTPPYMLAPMSDDGDYSSDEVAFYLRDGSLHINTRRSK